MLVFRRLEGFGGSDRGPRVPDLADYPGFAKQQVMYDVKLEFNK